MIHKGGNKDGFRFSILAYNYFLIIQTALLKEEGVAIENINLAKLASGSSIRGPKRLLLRLIGLDPWPILVAPAPHM
jgi:hypothetical protein